MLISNLIPRNPVNFFKTKLKGDSDSIKEIEDLLIGFNNVSDDHVKNRIVTHNMVIKSFNSINSDIPNKIKMTSEDLNSGQYPKIIKELAINGNDLMNLGFIYRSVKPIHRLSVDGM